MSFRDYRQYLKRHLVPIIVSVIVFNALFALGTTVYGRSETLGAIKTGVEEVKTNSNNNAIKEIIPLHRQNQD